MRKLYIEDIGKIRITKVADYSVLFSYDGEKYMLRIDDYTHLYKRVPTNKSGKYTLEAMSMSYSSHSTIYYIRAISRKGNTLVYGQVDLEYFVRRLTDEGLVASCYSGEIFCYNEKIKDYKEEIAKLNKMIADMESRKVREGKKGLAYYLAPSIEEKYRLHEKAKIEKDPSYKEYHEFGEMCEKYGVPFGSEGKEFGGILTDIRSIEVGSYFHCCNGDWDGRISLNDNGEKVVVVYADSSVEMHSRNIITEDTCALYID